MRFWELDLKWKHWKAARPKWTSRPASSPIRWLRFRNKGLPRFGGKGKGDLYLQVKVRIPEKPDPEQREFYERLRALAGKARRRFWG